MKNTISEKVTDTKPSAKHLVLNGRKLMQINVLVMVKGLSLRLRK